MEQEVDHQECVMNLSNTTIEDVYSFKSRHLIGHGFYPLLAMVYKIFNTYLLRYRVYLEYLQVQGQFGGKWGFWCLLAPFECRAAQTQQMSSYLWRPSHR